MKKTYEAPSIEKIAFQYRDQVVAASMPQAMNWDPNNTGECTHTKDEIEV